MYEFNPSEKQDTAWEYLNDYETTEVLYGGAAGGGKTYLGSAWQIFRRIEYPGTRGLIGRSKLKNLKQTTLNTFFVVCKDLGLKPKEHYIYNSHDGIIKFPKSDSEIILRDLFLYPSDPEFTSLGGLELTDAFIDEANEVTEKACNMVNSRIRFKLDEFNLMPKTLYGCNPSKSWLYNRFYRPHKEGDMPAYRKFVQALVQDNPNPEFVSRYIEQLSKLPAIDRARLLDGDWEYDDDLTKMIEYSAILDIFTNAFLDNGEYYISVDAARKGSDRAVIMVWDGWRVIDMLVYDVSKTTVLESSIKMLANQYKIPMSRVVVDEDGVGGGIIDHLGCKGFVNNSRPIKVKGKDQNFQNLKTQCYYILAEKINERGMYILLDDKNLEYKPTIIKELESIRRHNVDKDGKLQIIPKQMMKEIAGHSPDFADCLMMRCIFGLTTKKLSW